MYAAPGRNNGARAEGVPTFLIEVDNSKEFEKVLETLVSQANVYFRNQSGGEPGQLHEGERPVMAFERLFSPERGFRLTSPAGVVPWLGADLQPTVMLGKSFIVLAATHELARAAIAAEADDQKRWSPDGELLRSLECLPPRLSFLNVGTIRDSCWPGAIASYPETAEPFVCQFCGLDVRDAQDAAPSPDLFSLLGIPKRGGSALRTPRANVPKANEIEALLFPSVLAATVDERSFRFLSLEALPFTCVWLEAKYEPPGFGQKMTIEFKFGSGK